MDLSVGAAVGPYQILGLVGRGGMGEVYRARDPRLGRDVAVKLLPREYAQDAVRLKRFTEEARAAGALNHPNILDIHDLGVVDERPYVVTELLEGETLSHRLVRQPVVPIREAIDTALQAAQGLAAAHEKGIVHRDLKPANLFLTRDGRVKILDFGLAKRGPLEEEPPDHSTVTTALTQPGVLLGTVAYMSPEQTKGLPLDARSDLFSLGVVIYEMLAGTHPFRRDTSSETLAAILHDEPEPLTARNPRASAALSHLVHRCLAKSCEERFRTAHDLCIALEAVAGPSGLVTASRSLAGGWRRWRDALGWRKRLAQAGLLAGLAVLAAAGGWLLASRRSEDSSPLSGVTSRPLTSDPGWESEPVLSPDGSLVAFTSNRSGNADIWVTDVGGGEELRLTDHPGPDYSPAWFPDGQSLAFVSERGGTASIWRVPRLGGTALQLLPDGRFPAISRDGAQIAFSRLVKGAHTRIAIMPVGRPDAVRVITGDNDGLYDHEHPAWSPDGRTLCYASFRDIWTLPAAGGPARLLTVGHVGDAEPAWSPDGRWIYFSSLREGTRALWRISSRGGHAQRVTLGTGPESQPSFSRDGRRLVYSTYLDDLDVVVVSRQTEESFRISGPEEDSWPALVPDGSAVVFTSDRAGTADLWVQGLSNGRRSGQPRRLTDQPGNESMPAISPDGRWVAYGNVNAGQRDIFMVPITGGLPVRLTSHPALDVHPAWSPDGTMIAFVSGRGGGEHVFVLRVKEGRPTGEPVRVTSGEATDYFPTWLPDGRSIAFIRLVKEEGEVWIAPADGGTPRPLTVGAQASYAKWDAASQALLVTGKWGGARTLARHVTLSGRTQATERFLSSEPFGGIFDVSRDGRSYAHTELTQKGDIWLLSQP